MELRYTDSATAPVTVLIYNKNGDVMILMIKCLLRQIYRYVFLKYSDKTSYTIINTYEIRNLISPTNENLTNHENTILYNTNN